MRRRALIAIAALTVGVLTALAADSLDTRDRGPGSTVEALDPASRPTAPTDEAERVTPSAVPRPSAVALSIPVPTIAETTAGDAAAIGKVLRELTHCTRGINYLGLPAVSVPAGFTSNGMPCAFQLVGRPFAEALLLRAADAYQRATDSHQQVPPAAQER